MKLLGMFRKHNVKLDEIQPEESIPIPKLPPLRSALFRREDVDCEFFKECKDYEELATNRCLTCRNNKLIKTKSFYNSVEA